MKWPDQPLPDFLRHTASVGMRIRGCAVRSRLLAPTATTAFPSTSSRPRRSRRTSSLRTPESTVHAVCPFAQARCSDLGKRRSSRANKTATTFAASSWQLGTFDAELPPCVCHAKIRVDWHVLAETPDSLYGDINNTVQNSRDKMDVDIFED